MKQWYEELFANYAKKYDKESFTKGTAGECDFLEQEIGFNRSAEILDIGCGTGRHCIELASRGYTGITGIDLSEAQLAEAKRKAAEKKLNISFMHGDARALPFDRAFDAAIMMCEGGFSLMETDEMNFEILKSASRALKQGGRFIFTTLNGLFPMSNSIEEFCSENSVEGNAEYVSGSFDLMTFRNHDITEFEDDDGVKKTIATSQRYYIPSEITWLLKTAGFRDIEIFGARLGSFSRSDTLTRDDFEMLVTAVRG